MAARSEVVLLEAGGSQGTGFLIAPGLLVTALHVVAEFDEHGRAVVDDAGLPFSRGRVTCTYYSEARGWWPEITGFDPGRDPHSVFEDWAVLRVRNAEGVRVWATDRAQPADFDRPCRAFGFPTTHGDEGTRFTGHINGISDPRRAWTTGSVLARAVPTHRAWFEEASGWAGQTPSGFSGGPAVVDDRVVGIVRRYLSVGGVALGGTVELTPIEAIYHATGIATRSRDAAHSVDVVVPASPKYVFVVHAAADKLMVARLCRDLLRHGVRPWLDLWDLIPGSDWPAELRAALADAPAVLVCDGPGGCGDREPEYAEVLRARLERDSKTVLRVALPGASLVGEGVERTELVEDWDDGVAALAVRLGIDRDRNRWLEREAEAAGVSSVELSPYRGLAAFSESDARWMFGRDEEIGSLLALAEKRALLTVIGASGSGKSSLVMAGLCPALRNGALGGERVGAIGYLRPGKSPCEELARALVSLSTTEDPVARALKVAELRDALRNSTDMLKLVIQETVSATDGQPAGKVVLVVDQLEELFTEARLGQQGESPEAMPFVRNIIEATKASDAPLWIVSTLRADFLPSCLSVAELARRLNSGTYFALPPMREDQIREAVELPARRAGFEVEPKLAEKLVAGAADQAGRLPLLEHVLRELWQRRDEHGRALRFAAYADAGGLEGAIAKAADRALAGLRERLGERALTVTRRLMTRLVRIGEGTQGDTRRRVTIDELGRDDETREVLDAFVRDARVLVSDEGGGVAVIEIAHEALLSRWQTLVVWLDADRGALRLRQELAADAVKFEKRRDTEYLWGKGRIVEARRVLAASTLELNDQERTFLEQGARADQAQSMRVWGTVMLVFVVLLGAFVFISNLDAENDRQAQKNAQQAQENAELTESESEARRLSDESEASQKGARAAMVVASTGSYFDAVVLAIEAVHAFGPDQGPPTADAYGGLLDVLAIEAVFELSALEGHSGSVNALAFSPDGSRLATASSDHTARLWDVVSGTPLATLDGHSGSVNALAFSPDGSRLVTISTDKTARLWDVASGKPLVTLDGQSGSVNAPAFSPDGSRLATVSTDQTARLWDVASGKPLGTLDGHSNSVIELVFSPDGSCIATRYGNTARLWDVATGESLATLEGHSRFVDALAFSPDGTRLATASWDKTTRLWNVATGKPLATLEGASPLAFSPDGTRLATASSDHTARLWDVATGKPLATLGATSVLAFSPDGTRLATSYGENARLWDVVAGKPLATLKGHSRPLTALAFSPDGTRLATASRDNTARLWNVVSGKPPVAPLEGHSKPASALAFSADGTRLATAGYDDTARLWDVASGKPVATLEGHSNYLTALVFSPDGTRLATASSDTTARLWDAASGKPLATLEGHAGWVNALTISPDGTRLATASSDQTARLWDVASGTRLATLEGHSSAVIAVAFSPDGTRLATTSSDQTARLWNIAESDKPVAVLEGHSSPVIALAFSPDGTRLTTVSTDNTARFWNVETGKALATLEGRSKSPGAGYAVSLSLDGSYLATSSSDGTARLWDIGSGKLLATLEGDSRSLNALSLSPDGSYLGTASSDGHTWLWDVETGQPLTTLEGHSADVIALIFSPDGTRLATASVDKTARLWPMPDLAVELACLQIEQARRYTEVAAICDPILAGTN